MGVAFRPDPRSSAELLLKKVLVFAITARRVPFNQRTANLFFEPASLRKQQRNRMCAITHIRGFLQQGLTTLPRVTTYDSSFCVLGL